MRAHHWWRAVLALLATGACASPPAGPTPVEGPPTLGDLAPGTFLRVSQGGERTVGFLASVDRDTLRLEQDGRRWALARSASDTVWVKARSGYSNAGTGVMIGAAVIGLLTLALRNNPEGSGIPSAGALKLVGLLFGLGLVADIASPNTWKQLDPPPAAAPVAP